MPYVRKVLHIAPGTASTHINHIYQKLGVHSCQELLDMVLDEQG
jgi:DNA-binding CsgD family transcriptional regulator